MSAVDAFRRGDLEGALSILQDEVRAAPDDPRHRIFLFQLFAVLGKWDRALTQLNVARDLDPDAMLMAQAYQEVLRCEVLRQEVFGGQRSPMLLGEPDAWMAQAMEAQKQAALGQFEAAESLREEAWNDAPATGGTATLAKSKSGEEPDEGEATEEVELEWIADADTRLGPILEAIIDGRYYWVPFMRIQQIEFDPPADLRDIVWMPARFHWTNQGQAVGMIPTRYPASESHSDAEVRMARRTEWQDEGNGSWHGFGQRQLVSNDTEFGLMSLRKLELHPAS